MTEVTQEKSAKLPLLTVAMPVYNAGKYLRLAVLSILNQTFTNWELIIIDDGSTDNAILAISDIDDARIQILSDGENKGLAVRLNETVGLARGQYFARMDQDDISYPERFERQLKVLQRNQQLDVVATRAIIINEKDEANGMLPYSTLHDEICSRPWRGFHFPHPTWLGRIEWFRKYLYTVPAPYFCEDQDLITRSYNESRFQTLDETLFAYRIVEDVNWAKRMKTRVAVLEMQWKNFIQNRQFHFVALSLVTFLGRVLLDFFEKYLWKINSHNIEGYDEMSHKWESVLKDITKENE